MLAVKEIGRRIKQRRKQLGLSLQEVADEVKLVKSTISRYETGAIVSVSMPTLRAIAQALRVDVSWLTGETDKMLPPKVYTASAQVEDILAAARAQLMQQDNLMFDGKPATDEAIQSILDAMEIGLSLARKKSAAAPDAVKQFLEE